MAGKSDPYVTCEVVSTGGKKSKNMDKFQTKVMDNTLNPVWNHVGVINHFRQGQDLEFAVWDSDTFPKPDQLLGKALVSSQSFWPTGVEGDVPLSGCKHATGTLTIKVEPLDVAGVGGPPTQPLGSVVDASRLETADLYVTIVAAQGLPNADGALAGKSDPYVVVEVPGRKRQKFKTKVVNNCLDPVWNYRGVIYGYRPESVIEFAVWDKDTFKSDSLLGKAQISSQDFWPYGIEGDVTLCGTSGQAAGNLTLKIEVLAPGEKPQDMAGSHTTRELSMTGHSEFSNQYSQGAEVREFWEQSEVHKRRFGHKEVVQMPQVVTIKHVHDVQEHVREVEVPEVHVQDHIEEVVHTFTHEELLQQQRPTHVELIREELDPQYRESVKEVEKPVYVAREVAVEVPHVVNQEVIVEVPQVKIVDLIREVPKVIYRKTPKHVKKPVYQVRERQVEVAHSLTREQIQEVPRVEQAELIRQIPGPMQIQEVVKEVSKHEVEFRHVLEDVPHVEVQEQIVEVPEVEIREIIKQVPKIEIEYIEKRVPKLEINYVEKVVEVPHVVYEERIVEVPEIEIREVVRQVPKAVVQYVDKVVTKQENRYFDKVVEVPQVLEVERGVEVPQLVTVETHTEVLRPQWQQVEKPVQKVQIEARENQVEVVCVSRHEQAVEVDEIRHVDVVTQVPVPQHEIVEKQVPDIQTQIVEREERVPRMITREYHEFVPEIREVELIREHPVPVMREVEREIPKVRMEYKEINVQVNPKFVVDHDADGSMPHERELVGVNLHNHGMNYEEFDTSDFAVRKKKLGGMGEASVTQAITPGGLTKFYTPGSAAAITPMVQSTSPSVRATGSASEIFASQAQGMYAEPAASFAFVEPIMTPLGQQGVLMPMSTVIRPGSAATSGAFVSSASIRGVQTFTTAPNSPYGSAFVPTLR